MTERSIQTCFVIDDDIDDLEIFAMALQKVDDSINLRSASDCTLALKELKENVSYVPDYIFLDINMPKMNGLQCLPEIKKIPHLKDVKVIMYSTSSNEELKQTTRKLGADDFLVKPGKLGVLVNHLNRILEKPKS
ncbi:MAG: response regulator [Chitinophagaceae bacterium]|nr:response regulator [Chitinophagaceae bacterium]